MAKVSKAGRPDLLTGSTGRPYQQIDVMAVSPPPDEMGRPAAAVFERRTNGLGRFIAMDNWLVGQAIRGAGDALGRHELLSYLFFNEQ